MSLDDTEESLASVKPVSYLPVNFDFWCGQWQSCHGGRASCGVWGGSLGRRTVAHLSKLLLRAGS